MIYVLCTFPFCIGDLRHNSGAVALDHMTAHTFLMKRTVTLHSHSSSEVTWNTLMSASESDSNLLRRVLGLIGHDSSDADRRGQRLFDGL